uniref:Myosin motor domain-containing protein n=1 Tax=Denticeps clupeoides TaxID=299321 RepID=A0AAY4EQJ7_9TELE
MRLKIPSSRGLRSQSTLFSFVVPGWWDNLSCSIRLAETTTTFKKQLKTHLFKNGKGDSLEGEVRAFLTDEGELHTYDDLTKVNPVTPATVLRCLQARYRARVFYTHAGCTLVALNPFQPVPHLYSPAVMKEYHHAAQPQEFKPHIFIVAEGAYRNVQGQVEPANQSLVVSGESGAGKVCADFRSDCLRFFPTRWRGLETNNSSRFGKYVQLQLNRSQLLVGASVQTYLLEKTRVAFQAPSERNFHIFYQMVKGATAQQRQEWRMAPDQTFAWLPSAERGLEEDRFQGTLEAMVHLGIDEEKRGQIFRVLAGLLHLGNVTFGASSDESQPCGLPENTTAELLKVPPEELQTCLRFRSLKAGKQSALLKPCSQSECSVRRDCLAKLVYAHLFDWLVAFINSSICADSSEWSNFIGLLDVYGFECFLLNHLEQLCINYANEKLQQHFVAHYLKAQQEEYVSEGLEWSFVKYQDNQGCLDLIEGSPVSVFSLLNEECRLNRPSDAGQFRVRLEKELSPNGSISWDKFNKQPHFTVAHYAGNVSYQIPGMMEKNKDPVPPELVQMLQRSEEPLLLALFAKTNVEDSTTKGHSKVVTVVSKFKSSLESLMKILHSTTPHYTRCIKPNPDCRPLTFKKEEVILQLEACGIVETINISAAGFPIRIPYARFLQRYGAVAASRVWAQLDCDRGSEQEHTDILSSAVADVLREVLKSCCPDPWLPHGGHAHSSLVHCGKTKVFVTHAMVSLELLERWRDRARSERAFRIQCCWRRYRRRRRGAERRAAILIQAAIRTWLVRREIQIWQKAAAVIQRRWRKWRALMDALAEAELDDAEDLQEKDLATEPILDPLVRERGSVQLSSLQEPVTVRSWPLGLVLASPPSISVSLTAKGFQKVVSMMATLRIPFRNGGYKVETNQFDQGVASIRAQPRGSIKLHFQKSPLLYADMHPGNKVDSVTGFNQILLEKT